MTKERALVILKIIDFLKKKPQESFSLEQLLESGEFGKRTQIIESLGYLAGKKVIAVNEGSYGFEKDLDEETLQKLRKFGEIKISRPKI